MNDKSHIQFSRQVLKLCQLDERAAYLANLPAFIRQKHTYNNVFIQPLSHLPDMLEVAVHIFTSLDDHSHDEKKTLKFLEPALKSLNQDIQGSTNYMESYYYHRKHFFYQQILHAMKEISDQYTFKSQEKQISKSLFCKENEVALFLSFLSFVYFGLWLAPRQLFFPMSSFCSGSWELWEEIDCFKLLEEFLPESEKEFFPEIYDSPIWDEPLDPYSLIKAMLIRMGEKGSPPIAYSIVDRTMREFLRYLGLNEYKRVDIELEFLRNYESQQEELFRKLFKK
tara:strand:- start:85 stop:930 length:846 start_codon:yes stop_codon:yes gene_type:complete